MNHLREFAQGLAMAIENSRAVPPPESDALRPLGVRLDELLRRIPPEIQARGLSLRDLQQQLRGRKARTCHHAELAHELFRRGWCKRRKWAGAGAPWPVLWFPPQP